MCGLRGELQTEASSGRLAGWLKRPKDNTF